ncbi:MAG: hypothetical protein PVF66_12960 [Candidatus Aminicenantes bacterium]
MAKTIGERMNQKTFMIGIKRKIKTANPARDNRMHAASQKTEYIFFTRASIVFSRIYPKSA